MYANSNLWPLTEDAALDQKSRHIGKAETENWLLNKLGGYQIPLLNVNIPFRSISILEYQSFFTEQTNNYE